MGGRRSRLRYNIRFLPAEKSPTESECSGPNRGSESGIGQVALLKPHCSQLTGTKARPAAIPRCESTRVLLDDAAFRRGRAQGMPGAVAPAASCARNAQTMHTRNPQVQPNTRRHPLRNGLRLIRTLPGVPGLLATVACRFVTTGLIPASGDQDHTTSPSASAAARRARPKASIASCANVRDDA